MAAPGPAPLLPAEAEALVQALRSTELRDTGGQGCGGTGSWRGGPRSCVFSWGARRKGCKFGVSLLGLHEVGGEE